VSRHPTPTRLALLRDVAAGNVILAGGRKPAATLQAANRQAARRVDIPIGEMERAGWIERPDRTAAWRLTDAGREVLGG